jgi:hypothetical protein
LPYKVGEIKPWWDADVESWVFQHPLYPEECGGETAEQVIAEYPLVLANFMQARLAGELAPSIEAKTKGRGGYRAGSGRPKGSTSAPPTKMVRLPVDVADWLKTDDNLAVLQSRIKVDFSATGLALDSLPLSNHTPSKSPQEKKV